MVTNTSLGPCGKRLKRHTQPLPSARLPAGHLENREELSAKPQVTEERQGAGGHEFP